MLRAVAVLACIVAPTRSTAQAAASRAIALRGVSVVDVARGTVTPDQTIIWRGDRILSVGASRSTTVPRGAPVLDGRGKYAIPGLWDMHVHHFAGATYAPLYRDSVLRPVFLQYLDALFLANGITGVRDMAGDLAALQAARTAARSLGEAGPRVVATGEKLGLAPVVAGAPFPITTADAVRQSVALLKKRGAAHVKLDVGLSGALFRAGLQACREHAIPCTGHVSEEVPPDEASSLGQRSEEHLFLFPEYTSRLASQLIAWLREVRRPTLWQRAAYKLGLRTRPPNVTDQAIATHDQATASALFHRLAANSTWVTPTLALSALMIRADPLDSLVRNDRYLLLARGGEFRSDPRSEASRRRAVELQHLQFRLVREMFDAGTPLLAGTDTPVLSVPGFSLHDELSLLVRAGLTPAAALRAATVEPARYLGAQDTLGRVAAGHVADLVLLRANPLVDIGAIRSIEMVAAAGRVFHRRQLDSLLSVADSAAIVLRSRLSRPH